MAADPFVTALGVLLQAAGSTAAIYQPQGGTPVPLRLVHHQPCEPTHLSLGNVVQDGNIFMIAMSDIALPARGDIVQVGSEIYTVLAAPILDSEGMTWAVQVTLGPA